MKHEERVKAFIAKVGFAALLVKGETPSNKIGKLVNAIALAERLGSDELVVETLEAALDAALTEAGV